MCVSVCVCVCVAAVVFLCVFICVEKRLKFFLLLSINVFYLFDFLLLGCEVLVRTDLHMYLSSYSKGD